MYAALPFVLPAVALLDSSDKPIPGWHSSSPKKDPKKPPSTIQAYFPNRSNLQYSMASSAQIAIPGQRLGPLTTYSAGPGTHVQESFIYASIAGPVITDAQSKSQSKPTLRVSRVLTAKEQVGNPVGPDAAKAKPRYNTLPAVESNVLVRVTRVQKRQATVSILVVLDESEHLTQSQTASDNDNVASILTSAANPENHSGTDELRFQALIRKEDVRAVEKDRVVMDEMFRVGDIVRGSVISLGDQSFYYITTARNDLGVVMARSDAGNMMFPVSWKEMRDPVTGAGEPRKVARPF